MNNISVLYCIKVAVYNSYNQQWTDILKACNLAHRRMYEMRHTCATNLLMSGKYSVNEIASVLGHTTPQMLFERYTRNISAERKPFNKSVDIYGIG